MPDSQIQSTPISEFEWIHASDIPKIRRVRHKILRMNPVEAACTVCPVLMVLLNDSNVKFPITFFTEEGSEYEVSIRRVQ